MKIKITYHTDRDSREGCHRVTKTYNEGTKNEYEGTIFLIDEPGAWFYDHWNCHVDGQNFPCNTREEAIIKGLQVLGYLDIIEKTE